MWGSYHQGENPLRMYFECGIKLPPIVLGRMLYKWAGSPGVEFTQGQASPAQHGLNHDGTNHDNTRGTTWRGIG